MYKHPSVSIRPRRHAIRYSRFFIIHFGIASPPASLFPRIRPFPTRKSTMAVLARETNKLPRSQAVAVFYFENHSVLNVRLITGSLLSSTPACRQAGGKLRFPRPPFLMRIHPRSQAVGEFCAWIKASLVFLLRIAGKTSKRCTQRRTTCTAYSLSARAFRVIFACQGLFIPPSPSIAPKNSASYEDRFGIITVLR